jgi:uroporphyrinogen-III synthase
MASKVNILCTAPLDESLIKKAAANGLNIDVLPLIDIKPILTQDTEAAIMKLYMDPYNVVFTSANAVKFMPIPDFQPDWKIFCISNITKDAVIEKYGRNTVAETADSASMLANEIVNRGIEKILFFCGDSRRNELPQKLKSSNVAIREVIIYETIPTPQKISRKYEGILFFSPSAVKSYFSNNKTTKEHTLFAIGKTTANEIKKNCKNKIIISKTPDKKKLVHELIEFYGNPKTNKTKKATKNKIKS